MFAPPQKYMELESSAIYIPLRSLGRPSGNFEFRNEVVKHAIASNGFAVMPCNDILARNSAFGAPARYTERAVEAASILYDHNHTAALFHKVARSDDGQIKREEDGSVQMVYSKQRQQVIFFNGPAAKDAQASTVQSVRAGGKTADEKRAAGVLLDMERHVRTAIIPCVRGTRSSTCCPEVRDVALLLNTVEQAECGCPVDVQEIHTDDEPYSNSRDPDEAPLNAILALTEVTIIIHPGSHTLVQQLRSMQDEGLDITGWLHIIGKQHGIRLHLKAGDLLIMHGNLVHGGDVGKCGVLAPRMHFYVKTTRTTTKANTTNPVAAMDAKFAALFV